MKTKNIETTTYNTYLGKLVIHRAFFGRCPLHPPYFKWGKQRQFPDEFIQDTFALILLRLFLCLSGRRVADCPLLRFQGLGIRGTNPRNACLPQPATHFTGAQEFKTTHVWWLHINVAYLLTMLLIRSSHDNLTLYIIILLCTDWWLRICFFVCCCTDCVDLNDILLNCGLDRNQHPTSLATQDPGTHLAQPHPPDFGPNGPANVQQLPHYHLSWWSTNWWHKCSTQEKWIIPQLGIGLTKNNKEHRIYLWHGVFTQDLVDVYCKCIVYMDLQNTLMDFYNILCRVYHLEV